MRSFLTAALLAACAAPARADLRLPTCFGSHMVLQRGKPVVVWGWTEPGTKVAVSLGDEKAEATADGGGTFKATLKAREASDKGVTLTVEGDGTTVSHSGILFGDVWVGSGQSNMEWSMAISGDSKKHIGEAEHPLIRLYHVPKFAPNAPQRDIDTKWRACTPKTVPAFSAALYHFGVAIQKDQKIPIGLINSSWGGSKIEPWTVSNPAPKGKGTTSGGMYNGMIHPIRDLAVKGVLWYQGESNMSEGMGYYEKKARLIKDWRKFWGDDMPFYFVQIAPYSKYGGDAELLPKLWEAQTACLKLPNTGMIVVTDAVHNIDDIHPADKKTVGDRLALWALAKTYGKKDIVYSGPLFKEAKFDGAKATVSFAHGKGLKSRDGKDLATFELAGEDGKWHAAEAKIEGETVVVTSKDVEKPANVRFGWSKTTNPNLANGAGLPAGPFRSKDWKGGTGE